MQDFIIFSQTAEELRKRARATERPAFLEKSINSFDLPYKKSYKSTIELSAALCYNFLVKENPY